MESKARKLEKWNLSRSWPIMAFLAASVVLVILMLSFRSAQAKESDLEDMLDRYPAIAGTALDDCVVCHQQNSFGFNPYGRDYDRNSEDFDQIAEFDSDGDGFTNAAEIAALTFPGDPNSKPAAPPAPSPTPEPTATTPPSPTPPPTNTPIATAEPSATPPPTSTSVPATAEPSPSPTAVPDAPATATPSPTSEPPPPPPPAGSALIAPSGVISDNQPSFSWLPVANASGYWFWMQDQGRKVMRLEAIESVQCSEGVCTLASTEALCDGDYYWTMISVQEQPGSPVFGSWQNYMAFHVNAGTFCSATALSPTGSIPATGGAADVEFRWEAAGGASWYWLHVVDGTGQAAYSAPVAPAEVCSGAACDTTINLPGGEYRWWVLAWNGLEYQAPSQPLLFSVTGDG